MEMACLMLINIPGAQPKRGGEMSMNFGSRAACLVLAATAAAAFVAPAAEATPITYDFTVNVTSGPLSGTSSSGSFSYDSSSIVPGGDNNANGLLIAFDFTFNGTTYDTSTVDTGTLIFDSSGNLTDFGFGNNCHQAPYAPNCVVAAGTDGFIVDGYLFVYSAPGYDDYGWGDTTFALASGVPVPEPDSLDMFGLGALLIGLLAGLRRRLC
jgi:hypothetical protein